MTLSLKGLSSALLSAAAVVMIISAALIAFRYSPKEAEAVKAPVKAAADAFLLEATLVATENSKNPLCVTRRLKAHVAMHKQPYGLEYLSQVFSQCEASPFETAEARK